MKKQKTCDAPVAGDQVDFAAISEMAKQIYLGEQVKDAKAKALAKFIGAVNADEQVFKDGVPFEFTLDTPDGVRKITGRLELRNRRDWADVDVVVEKA